MYDTVYYWSGGREEGKWRETISVAGTTTIQDTLDAIRRAGYVAHPGSRAHGAPEGPPSKADFRKIGM